MRNTREVVEVFAEGPELSYWVRAGGLKKPPLKHPPYVEKKFIYILKDGADRRKRDQGDGLCGHCFQVIKTPLSGSSNVTSHWESCGADGWIDELKTLRAKTDRRLPQTNAQPKRHPIKCLAFKPSLAETFLNRF